MTKTKSSGCMNRISWMPILFIFLFFGNIRPANAQCKLEKGSRDFSSSQVTYTHNVKLMSVFPLIGTKEPWTLVMSFYKVDSGYLIHIIHESQSISSEIGNISFKFKDGTMITKNYQLSVGDYNTGFGYSYTYTTFPLAKEELKKFASSKLVKFQALLNNNSDYPVVENKIKKGTAAKIRNYASCILSYHNSIPKAKKIIKNDFSAPCKYAEDKVDDFTKKRTVATSPEFIYDIKSSAFESFLTVVGSNVGGSNGLQFNMGIQAKTVINGNINEDAIEKDMTFDQIDLLLDNGDVINLKKRPSQFIGNNYTWNSYELFSIKNDTLWKKLKTFPLKKFRMSINGQVKGTQAVNKQYSRSIMRVINCIDKLNIPKSK